MKNFSASFKSIENKMPDREKQYDFSGTSIDDLKFIIDISDDPSPEELQRFNEIISNTTAKGS